MDKRAYDHAIGVHNRAVEVEVAHWLAIGSARPCALMHGCPCVWAGSCVVLLLR